ncbi:hypothetical protein GLT81_00425 [Nanohaloarchaea archaeon]|jgi:hypothetical protein|nr:hypothetical protein [Candidatus Nanohaloarchaea archaeon]
MDSITMSSRWSKNRLLESSYAFEILKIISSREEGSYASEINDLIERNDREEVSRVISKFEELGLVKKGKRTRAQYYELRSRGLTELLSQLWDFQSPPNKTDSVLEKYLRNYKNPGSNLNGFLRRDFAYAVNELQSNEYSDNLDEMMEMFKEIEEIKMYRNPSLSLKHALKENSD